MSDNETFTPIQSAAIDLYKPPFSYNCGYIHDGDGKVFADEGFVDQMESMIAARIRGWGRISYMKDFNPEDLQDEVGKHCAQAMTEYWSKHVKST